VVTVVAAVLIAWWMDHRNAVYACNARCNPIISYAEDLKSALVDSKVRLQILEDLLVKLHVERGGSEQAIRKELDGDASDWSILEESKPYSYH